MDAVSISFVDFLFCLFIVMFIAAMMVSPNQEMLKTEIINLKMDLAKSKTQSKQQDKNRNEITSIILNKDNTIDIKQKGKVPSQRFNSLEELLKSKIMITNNIVVYFPGDRALQEFVTLSDGLKKITTQDVQISIATK